MKKSFKIIGTSILFIGTIVNAVALILVHHPIITILAVITLICFISAWVVFFSSYEDIVFKTHEELLLEKQQHLNAKRAHLIAERRLLEKLDKFAKL